jgi:hypothetical protein
MPLMSPEPIYFTFGGGRWFLVSQSEVGESRDLIIAVDGERNIADLQER